MMLRHRPGRAEYLKAWAEANRERIRSRMAEWRIINRERIRQQAREAYRRRKHG
jgi:hypothetical protein